MKKYCILALVLVLTLSAFTGCGCTNSRKPAGMSPTDITTVPTEAATIAPTTTPIEAATLPTETVPSATEGMIPDVTDNATNDASTPMDTTDNTGSTENSRSRSRTIR